MNNKQEKSLINYFEVPNINNNEYRAYFTIMCSYSADGLCMEKIAEAFTGQTKHERSYTLPSIILMQEKEDLGVYVPGVLQLERLESFKKDFALLHAKVAILAFQNTKTGKLLLRLLVSTGNFTSETLSQSLDLMWTVEIKEEDFTSVDSENQTIIADIKAAWSLLKFVLKRHQIILLEENKTLSKKFKLLEDKIGALKIARNIKTRFINSSNTSLLTQFTKNIPNITRNFLAMGSGFYEDGKSEPTVPHEIINMLSAKLTKSSKVKVYINPNACQSFAHVDVNNYPYKICPPYTESRDESTFMHAKFIFSATARGESLSSIWCYIGSGNLSKQGFVNKAGKNGNLEAGVVFFPSKMLTHELPKYLPISYDNDKVIESLPSQIESSDLPNRNDELLLAFEIPYLLWIEKDRTNYLQIPIDNINEDVWKSISNIKIYQPDGSECQKDDDKYIWNGEKPLSVKVEIHRNNVVTLRDVLVMGEDGHIGHKLPPITTTDELIDNLLSFPILPTLDNDTELDDGADFSCIQSMNPTKINGQVNYSIRKIMQIIEKIAQKQCSLDEWQWINWCENLKTNMLELTKTPSGKEEIKTLISGFDTNPLVHLLENPFVPQFAEKGEEKSQIYQTIINEIINKWESCITKKEC